MSQLATTRLQLYTDDLRVAVDRRRPGEKSRVFHVQEEWRQAHAAPALEKPSVSAAGDRRNGRAVGWKLTQQITHGSRERRRSVTRSRCPLKNGHDFKGSEPHLLMPG